MGSVVTPVRFRDRTLDTFTPGTTSAGYALTAARLVVAGEIRNLVLAGPTGVGKTHIAAGIVHALADRLTSEHEAAVVAMGPDDPYPRQGHGPEWINIADAIVRVRLEFGAPADDRESTSQVMRLHTFRGLVVMDDLGREKVSDWTGELVYALVNARYEAMLPTVVTTNLTSAELAESPYWPAISRLAEDGELVRIDAPDKRLARRYQAQAGTSPAEGA